MSAALTFVVSVGLLGCSNSGTSTTGGGTTPTPTIAARSCDVFATAGTPCVAAYSTTRSMFAAYTGPLYQVTRASDNTTLNIALLSDGYANAASQDTFCINTTCTITRIYDQTSNGNHLTVAPPGGNAVGTGPNGYDLPANASELPIMAGGHKVYGIYIHPGMGYRNDNTTGIATNGQPEGVYMVTSTDKLTGYCCFDFGNAETNNKDNHAGHMDAISMGCPIGSGTPCINRVGLDMENGILGNAVVTAGTPFVSAMGANDGQTTYNVWQGNAQSGVLTAAGPKALPAAYSPMQQEGAIVLGIGGDNSDGDEGYFFEGAMTRGTPSDATMNSVQANILTAMYFGL